MIKENSKCDRAHSWCQPCLLRVFETLFYSSVGVRKHCFILMQVPGCLRVPLGQGTCKFAGTGSFSTAWIPGVVRLGGKGSPSPLPLLTLCDAASNTTRSRNGWWLRAVPKKASPVPRRRPFKTDAEVRDTVTDPRFPCTRKETPQDRHRGEGHADTPKDRHERQSLASATGSACLPWRAR